MSNIKKISHEIESYIIQRKKKNPDLSCRSLTLDARSKFNIYLSKSSINRIIKAGELSSPVGRRVTKVFRPYGQIQGAGFAFLHGAGLLLGLPRILANICKKIHPSMRLKLETLEAISEAWIISKAIYNVSLEKIEEYDKSELWFITGRKINKGLLRQYIEIFKSMQPINYQLVRELTHILQDVHYLKFTMSDGSQYCIDGQLKSVWRDSKIPVDFCVTIDTADSYINDIFFRNEPMVITSARPESMLGEEISDFIFSCDAKSAAQRIRKIEFFSPKGELVKEIPFIVPGRRKFIMGIWPWQYKTITQLEKIRATESFLHEPLRQEFCYMEDKIIFTQHTQNIDVMLRLIIIKSDKNGPARIGILTNLDPEEWSASSVVEHYVRRCPNFEAGHSLFLKATKNPLYFEQFISSEKILASSKKIIDTQDPDGFFSVLVELLNIFAQRVFFPADCSTYSLLKMRELFYKQRGLIKRDLAEDVTFNIFDSNELTENDLLNSAAIKFNEAPVVDFSGRKLWILTPSLAPQVLQETLLRLRSG